MTPDLDTKPAAPKTPPLPKTPRWVKVALVASLAVNLAVAGVVGGAVLRHGPDRGDRADYARNPAFGGYARALSREDRRAILTEMRGRSPDRAALRDDRIKTFGKVIAALTAEPFDAAEVKALLAAQLDMTARAQTLGQDLLMSRITAMTPSERAAFAARLQQALDRGPDGETPRRSGG
ncbi:periplasmic heavy metal sensor [Pseudogemmobacter sp. W21_MBD1_M6]|uniref:periplasmic heavy metal sensor n=1 Tax=Pseudogemmobacter sp. W21_MBD1_M6 TaxID=3240271 RepID=UPI003F94B2C5